MQSLNSNNAPAAIGPYSHGYATDNLIFTSGQLGVDPKTGELKTGIEAQTEQAILNLIEVLKVANVGIGKVVKTTCFLAEIADFAKFNEVYSKYFISKPARSCFSVKDLPKGALCEIEAIAEI